MFDFDAGKLLIIGLVALVVIGPKDLPRVLRQVGQMVARLRKMAGEFQGQFMDAMKEADLQDLRAEVAKLKDSATLDVNFDPVHDVRTEISKAVDGVRATEPEPMAQIDGGPQAAPAGSDSDGFRLPEVAAEPNLVGAGIAPVAEIERIEAASTEVAASTPTHGTEDDQARRAPRKIMVPRRRPGSRFEAPKGRVLAPSRPRIIRRARPETADQ